MAKPPVRQRKPRQTAALSATVSAIEPNVASASATEVAPPVDDQAAEPIGRRLARLGCDPIAVIAAIACDEAVDARLRLAAARELAAYLMSKPRGTPAPAANTWTDVVPLTSTINAAANNLIVLIWSNAAMAQNATLDLACVQLEEGAVATPIEGRPHGIEFELCRRYLRVVNALNLWAYNTTALNGILDYSGMRAPPTLSLTGTLSCSDGIIAATAQSSANIGIAVSGGTAMRISMQNFTGLTQYRPYYIDPGASVGVIRVDSEL